MKILISLLSCQNILFVPFVLVILVGVKVPLCGFDLHLLNDLMMSIILCASWPSLEKIYSDPLVLFNWVMFLFIVGF